MANKILIVEDELLVAADIEANLEKNALDVVGIAADYSEAVALAEHHLPDLVLMDIQLRSQRNGIEAAKVIRDRWQIPVIFLTANANEQSLAAARAVGPYGFLTKPFRAAELNETVRIALQQRIAVKKLFAQHHWLNTVLASLTDAVVATDANGCVQFVNAAAERLTGWPSVEAYERSIEDVFHLTTIDGANVDMCPARQAMADGASTPKQQFLLHSKHGHAVPVELSAAAIVEGGEIQGAVTVNIDITTRLSQERLKELERDRLEGEAHSALESLGETRAELCALATGLMNAQEEERRRIGRELHDDLGQQSALLGMLIERVAQLLPFDRLIIDDLRHASTALAASLRDVSHRLHPAVIEDLGLAAALEQLIQQESSHGQSIRLTMRDTPQSMPVETATVLYRIAQEGLRNAAKHAPGAPVQLTLLDGLSEVVLRIEDEGPGISPEARGKRGLGLFSMQERARLAGGNFSLYSEPGEGTIVVVKVPTHVSHDAGRGPNLSNFSKDAS